MRKIIFALFCALALVSCKKEEETKTTTTTNTNNNNGGGGSGTFTVPTESYWRINGTNNSSSMDVCNVDLNGTNMSVSKPFTDLNFGYCQLRVFSNNSSLNITNDVAEGSYNEYYITTGSTSSNDSLRVELDVQDQNASTNGFYFYRAVAGKVYISKLNGKLRFTSDGTLQMSGVKSPNMQDYIYTCELQFSQEDN